MYWYKKWLKNLLNKKFNNKKCMVLKNNKLHCPYVALSLLPCKDTTIADLYQNLNILTKQSEVVKSKRLNREKMRHLTKSIISIFVDTIFY